MLGLDVDIDRKLRPWVTNISHDPALRIHLSYGDVSLTMGLENLPQKLSETDLYVNRKVVTDAIRLAKKSRNALCEIDTFGCLKKIGPQSEDEAESNAIYESV